ncbi:NAD(P)H-hydrate dehydratase [Brevibacillus thermoruber]|uniref:NAD(P)H-hydrate dehydratase n=1 Tax=Brevibacillus thermoruber TaxID=33942 RepID=UPI00404360C2
MYVVTAEEMQKMDRHVIDVIGIPAAVLMENAGSAIARDVQEYSRTHGMDKGKRPPRWAILVGKGNNGGDGLVAARHLMESGVDVTLLFAQLPEQLTGEAARQQEIARRLGIPAIVYGTSPVDWRSFDGIVDALLGTGSKGAPRGPYADLIREANASGLPIISADIPSGLDADTGVPHDPCIQAARTVALAFLKRGLVQTGGLDKAGEVVVRPIGIWPSLADTFGVQTFLLGEQLFRERFRLDPRLPRQADTHKGTYGHVLVVAGSREMSGAGLLCSKAALRAGSGLVTWVMPDALLPALIGHVPEVMLAGLPGEWNLPEAQEKLIALVRSRSVTVIGPGLGRFPGDADWLRMLWEETNGPLVLDADALNMLADADHFPSWPKREAPTILTPHPGEMARLAKVATSEVQQNRIELARSYARHHRLTLVLKGAGTVVATPDGRAYINPTGNPGMATGGAGDVLAGMIGGLLAQGLPADHATCLAVWLHGSAGDRAAAKRPSGYSLIAGDILEEL